MIQHTFGLLVRPSAQWRTVADLPESSFKTLVLYPCFLAILPAVAWFYGTSQVGWTVGEHGETIKLTHESARQICILFYLTMVACVAVSAIFIHWMSDTYGAESSLTKRHCHRRPDRHPAVYRRAGRLLSLALAGSADRSRRGELVGLPDVPGHSHCHEYSRGAGLSVLQRGAGDSHGHTDLPDGWLGYPLGFRRRPGIYRLSWHRAEHWLYRIWNSLTGIEP